MLPDIATERDVQAYLKANYGGVFNIVGSDSNTVLRVSIGLGELGYREE